MSRNDPKLRPHEPIPSGNVALNEVKICTCGCLFTDAIHRQQGLDDEQRAALARQIGDR